MGILVLKEVVYAACVEGACTSDNSVHLLYTLKKYGGRLECLWCIDLLCSLCPAAALRGRSHPGKEGNGRIKQKVSACFV